MINWTNEPPSTLLDYDQTKEKQQIVCTFTFETLKQESSPVCPVEWTTLRVMQSKIGQITSSLRSRPVEVLNDNFEGNSTEKKAPTTINLYGVTLPGELVVDRSLMFTSTDLVINRWPVSTNFNESVD